jgi:uncharacterized protein (TIGR02145 family)
MRKAFLFLILSFCFFKILSAQSITDVESIIDSRDGQVYKFVRIGDKSWMLENLNYSSKSGSWCYDENVSNCDLYGRLYDWQTAKNVCPHGWRLPSKKDFENLLSINGGSERDVYDVMIYSFTCDSVSLLSGWRDSDGYYFGSGMGGGWWSSSKSGSDNAWFFEMYILGPSVSIYERARDYGHAVRCVKK